MDLLLGAYDEYDENNEEKQENIEKQSEIVDQIQLDTWKNAKQIIQKMKIEKKKLKTTPQLQNFIQDKRYTNPEAMSFFANQWKLDEHGTFITSAFGDSNDYIAFEHLSTDNFLSLREEQAAKAAQFVKERSEDAINGKMKMNFVSAKKSD